MESREQISKSSKERQRDTATYYNIQHYSYKTAADYNTDYNAITRGKE